MKKSDNLRSRLGEVRDYAIYEHKLPPRTTFVGLSKKEKDILDFFLFFFARDYITMAKRNDLLEKKMSKINKVSLIPKEEMLAYCKIAMPKIK